MAIAGDYRMANGLGQRAFEKLPLSCESRATGLLGADHILGNHRIGFRRAHRRTNYPPAMVGAIRSLLLESPSELRFILHRLHDQTDEPRSLGDVSWFDYYFTYATDTILGRYAIQRNFARPPDSVLPAHGTACYCDNGNDGFLEMASRIRIGGVGVAV